MAPLEVFKSWSAIRSPARWLQQLRVSMGHGQRGAFGPLRRPRNLKGRAGVWGREGEGRPQGGRGPEAQAAEAAVTTWSSEWRAPQAGCCLIRPINAGWGR